MAGSTARAGAQAGARVEARARAGARAGARARVPGATARAGAQAGGRARAGAGARVEARARAGARAGARARAGTKDPEQEQDHPKATVEISITLISSMLCESLGGGGKGRGLLSLRETEIIVIPSASA